MTRFFRWAWVAVVILALPSHLSAQSGDGLEEGKSGDSKKESMPKNSKTVTLTKPSGDSKRLKLVFKGLKHSEASFAVRVFVNASDAEHLRVASDNPHFLGTVYVYGHGESLAALRADPKKSDSFDAPVLVSAGALKIIAAMSKVELTFVIEGTGDAAVDLAEFEYESLSWK